MDFKTTGGLSNMSLLLAIIAVLASLGFFMCKALEKRAYEQKWSEYDECGLV